MQSVQKRSSARRFPEGIVGLRRGRTPTVGSLGDEQWAAFELTRRALSRPPSAALRWLDVEPTMPAPARLAENGLLSAALGNITLKGY